MKTIKLKRAEICAVLSTSLFLLSGIYILNNGHPHEDAYILFIFSEILSNTGIISFFENGPNAEGATDFLWMLLISAMNFLGIDAALSALLLNTCGIFLISHLIFTQIENYSGGVLLLSFYIIIIPIYLISISAYGGFSTGFYSAIVLWLFVTIFQGDAKHIVLVPLISILIGLIRPDGVIIGVVSTWGAFYLCKGHFLKNYIVNILISIIIGLAYFLWRWRYFGEFLPLPLIVKSETDVTFPGLSPNIQWLKINAMLTLMSLLLLFSSKIDRPRLLLAVAPTIILVIALTFAMQSQNMAYRFQAPLSAILLFTSATTLSLFREAAIGNNTKNFIWILFISIFGAVHIWYHAEKYIVNLSYLTNEDYINFFPFHLAKTLSSDTRVVLTEAGRMAYWIPGEKYDLVGLTTAYTATNGADPKYIDELNPDIIFIHVAGTIDYNCGDVDFCQVNSEEFLSIIEKTNSETFASIRNRVVRAPLVTYAFLTTHLEEFDLIFVRYAKYFNHFYAIKKDGTVSLEDFKSALSLSFSDEGQLSYWDMTYSK